MIDGHVRHRIGGFALWLAGLALACGAVGAAEVPPSSAPLSLYPLVLAIPLPPQAVVGSDQRRHLTYEVLATNLGAVPLKVQSIEVRADAGGATLLRHGESAIKAHMSALADWQRGVDEIAPSATATIWLDVVLDAGASVPVELETTIAAVGAGPQGSGRSSVRVASDPRAPRVLRPPLQGAYWAAFEACCDAANHHRRGQRAVDGRLRLPERYAIDFVQLDAQGELHRGDGTRNEDYHSFGQPVLAVADAVVADVYTVQQDRPPRQPLPPPTLPEAGGNHVILDLGGGVWAMYGHLKAGSVRVRAGDKVRAGQVLGAVGNNGNSDLPHLHFQLMDTRNFALAQGMPFVFANYDLVGRVDVDSERFVAEPKPLARQREMPLTLSVLNFAPSR
ncbi:MAG: M23 family metallopeptidase [Rhodanobacteraceae bacterium]|jgi:biotin carboxyl carrier protein|nr:M23 family metallopeptidase [Rhodanobacteraceae bacterium]